MQDFLKLIVACCCRLYFLLNLIANKSYSSDSPQSIKRRMRRSAISLACEAYLFITESIGLLFMLFTLNHVAIRDMFIVIWTFEFGFKSVIQAMSGQATRIMFMSILRSMDIFGLHDQVRKVKQRICRWLGCASAETPETSMVPALAAKNRAESCTPPTTPH